MTTSFTLRSNQDAQSLYDFLRLNWEREAARGKPLEVTIGDHERRRTIMQNKRLHALLNKISQQSFVCGRAYNVETWKEFYKRNFLPSQDIEMPLTGEVISQPISTARLSVEQFNKFMTEVEAHAAQELQVNLTEGDNDEIYL